MSDTEAQEVSSTQVEEAPPKQNLIDGTPLFSQTGIITDKIISMFSGKTVNRWFATNTIDTTAINNAIKEKVANRVIESIDQNSYPFITGVYKTYLKDTALKTFTITDPLGPVTQKLFVHSSDGINYIGFNNFSIIARANCNKNGNDTGYVVVNIMPVVAHNNNHLAKSYMKLQEVNRKACQGELSSGTYVVAVHGYYAPTAQDQAAYAAINYCLHADIDSYDVHTTTIPDNISFNTKTTADKLVSEIFGKRSVINPAFSLSDPFFSQDEDTVESKRNNFKEIENDLEYVQTAMDAYFCPTTTNNPIIITIP
jgi:hypothetical protein